MSPDEARAGLLISLYIDLFVKGNYLIDLMYQITDLFAIYASTPTIVLTLLSFVICF